MPAVQETVEQVRRSTLTNTNTASSPISNPRRRRRAFREDTVRFISAKKNEPEWMLDWRLEAYRRWLTMREPTWARVDYPEDRLPERLLLRGAEEERRLDSRSTRSIRSSCETYEKLGIPLREQEILAGVVRPRASAASRSTRCSIPSRSPPPSRKS